MDEDNGSPQPRFPIRRRICVAATKTKAAAGVATDTSASSSTTATKTTSTTLVDPANTRGGVDWRALSFGQWLSLLISGSGAASTTLATECGVSDPTTQTLFVYAMMSLHLFSLPRARDGDGDAPHHALPLLGTRLRLRLRAPWYFYLVLAFLDVEANYLTYLAYRYTSFTSITLLSAAAVPSTMVFSRLVLRRRYGARHAIGAATCAAGLALSVLGDRDDDDACAADDGASSCPASSRDDRLLGDAAAAVGAVLYGLNDALFETSVRALDPDEYLGVVGLFGAAISVLQIAATERGAADDDETTTTSSCAPLASASLLAANAVFLYAYYVGASRFLLRHDAALLDNSLLTANLFAAAFVFAARRTVPTANFLAAAGLVVVGVLVYESGTTGTDDETRPTTTPAPARNAHARTTPPPNRRAS